MALDAVPPAHAALTDVPPHARVPREVQLQSKLDCFFAADPLHFVGISRSRVIRPTLPVVAPRKNMRVISRLTPKFFVWSLRRVNVLP